MRHVGLGILGGLVLAVTPLRVGSLEARTGEGDGVDVPTPATLVSAARQAEEGDLKASAASILAVEPRISNASTGLRKDQDFALRIAARIIARGEKPPFSGFPSDEEQIKWAYLQVRKQKEAGASPSLLTDFGEIAARIPTERTEALKTLEDLEERGAIRSSFGHATLARLRGEVGSDSAAVAGAPLRALLAGKRQVALTRCTKMAKVASTCDKGLLK